MVYLLQRNHQWLLLSITLILSSSLTVVSHAQVIENDRESDQEMIKIMVGFRNSQGENDYIAAASNAAASNAAAAAAAGMRGSISSSSNMNNKIKHQFKNAHAVAMEVTRAEFEQMRNDDSSLFQYVEEDITVYKAKRSSNHNNTSRRALDEIISYGLWRTQSDVEILPATTEEDCVINLCVVDSGVFLDHQDIPYSVNDGYTRGEEFGIPSNQRWYNPQGTDHGSAVAGIMIAKGGNNEGVVGVLPDGPEQSKVCLMVARVFADGEDSTSISSIIAAAEWCADRSQGRPTVINLSVAADFRTSTEAKIYENIYERSGALLVAAAGNAGSVQKSYPASHDSVISVASVDSQLRRSFWSQYNDQVELAAPGSSIQTTNADEETIDSFSGTSFACPFVSAIATKIWAAHPECTNQEIRWALRDSALRLGNGLPNPEFGYGLVQAVDAHDYLVENYACAQTKSPTATPSANPTPAPTPIPCQAYMETCFDNGDCCDGYSCRRTSADSSVSWVCRTESASATVAGDGGGDREAKPKLASIDDSNCRGGFAGGCTLG